MSAAQPAGSAHRVAKNTLVLTAGQLLSKLLGVVYLAALGRYVLANGLGQIAAAQALCSIVFVFVNLGLDTLVIRDVARTPQDAARYLANVNALKLALSAAAIAALVLIARVGPYDPTTQSLVLIYGLGSVLMALAGSARSLFQAFERMEYDSLLQVGRDLLNIAASLVAILLHASLITIVWISTVATLAQVAGAVVILRRLQIPWHSPVMPALAGRLFRTALPFSAIVVAATAYSQANTLLLPVLLGNEPTGLYSAAILLYSTLSLVPTAFSQAIFPLFARFDNSNTAGLPASYARSLKTITLVGMPLAVGTIFFGQPAMGLILGQSFAAGVQALQVLGLMFVLSGNYVNGALLNATGRQGFFASTYAGFLVLQLGLTLVLAPSTGPAGAAWSLLISTACGFVLYTAACHRFLGLRPDWHSAWKLLAASAAMATLANASLAAGLHFMLAACLAVAGYILMLLWLRVLTADEWAMLNQLVQSLRHRSANAGASHS